MEFNFGKLDNYFNVLSKNYQLNGEITWNKFNQDQKKNKNKVVLLKQEDFKYGTLRIKQPCMVKLTENIYFNPNRPESWIDNQGNVTENFKDAVAINPNRKLDWWPSFKLEENKQYFEKEVRNAYRLGFFAALTLESEEIILNLNNFTLQQHPEHTLQQRFFSVIELADQPFIPRQGPADFGATLRSASKVAIINGKIGLSSHHGIHGNKINTILIKNVDFIENEVAAIALNGSNDVYLVNVNVVRNRHDIPVMGTYSAGRFIKFFTSNLEDAISVKNENYIKYCQELNDDLDRTFNSVILKNGETPSIFKNNAGLIDGNYYGIIMHPLGIAVNAPLENRSTPKANESFDIYMKAVSINNVKTKINEILTLQNHEKKIMTAPSGAIFQFMEASEIIGKKFYYKGNTLSNLQVELIQVLKDNPHIKNFLGNFNLDEGLLIWRNNKDSYFEHDYDKLVGKGKLENINYNIIGNGDSMFHVNKGTFGLRIEGINTCTLDNISINNIEAFGEEGSYLAGNYQKSHPKQAHLNGYLGNPIFGLDINASNDINVENLSINSVSSKTGSASGICINGESIKVSLKNSTVENIKSCQDSFDSKKAVWPNQPTNSRGLVVGAKCDLTTQNLILRNIEQTPNCLVPSDCELYSVIKNS